jgi:hypothetical protein
MVAKKETPKVNLKYLRDKSRELVKGIFKFYEVPGALMSFNYREFKEDPIERFDLLDGEVYQIPLGVARHLNKNGWYPEYEFVQGDPSVKQSQFGLDTSLRSASFGGGAVQKVTKKVRRFGFQSLEFVDIEDMPNSTSSIVTVESV